MSGVRVEENRRVGRRWSLVGALFIVAAIGMGAHADEGQPPAAEGDHAAAPSAPVGEGEHAAAPPTAEGEHAAAAPAVAPLGEDDNNAWVEGQAAPDGEEIGVPMADRDDDFKDEVISAADDQELDRASANHDPVVFAAELRKIIDKVRGPLLEKIEAKIDRKAAKTMGRLGIALEIFASLGLLLLLTPVVLRKKYPGKGKLLLQYSALAAFTFIMAVNLFAGLLLGLKAIQAEVGKSTNPQITVVTAALDTLYDNAEAVAPMGAAIIKPTMEQLQSGDTDDPVPVALLENVARFAPSAKNVIGTLHSLTGFFKVVNVAMGFLPIVLTILAVVLLGMAIRPTLMEIVRMPAMAASGRAGVGADTLNAVFKRVKGELWATLSLLAVLVVVMELAGLLMSIAVRPAVDTFVTYLLGTFLYLQHTPEASGTNILFGLGATIFFLMLDILVVLVTTAMVLGKTQKIFQDRFHDGTQLAAHKRFFIWGYGGLLLNLLLPVIFVFISTPLVEKLIASSTSGEEVHWTAFFLTPPLALVLGFIAVFWAARGLKSLQFIGKYKVKPPKVVAQPHDTQPDAYAA